MDDRRLAVALRADVCACAVQTDGVVRDSCPCDFVRTVFNEHHRKSYSYLIESGGV